MTSTSATTSYDYRTTDNDKRSSANECTTTVMAESLAAFLGNQSQSLEASSNDNDNVLFETKSFNNGM